MQALTNKRVLVTGASGFIGNHLVAALAATGALVSVQKHNAPASPQSSGEYIGDITDWQFINRCVDDSKPEVIFHLAALKERTYSIESFHNAIRVNLLGALSLFSAAAKLPEMRKIVIAGTAEEYGQAAIPFAEGIREQPVSAYSFSKLCVTHLCEVLHMLYNLPFVVVRPTIAYGPGQGKDMFLPALISSLIENREFAMTPGEQTRDFIYVADLVDALIRAAQFGHAGEIYNIGSGVPVKIREVALQVGKMLARSELIKLANVNYRPGEVMQYCVDNKKARRQIGWQPQVNLEQGLRNTIDYYRAAAKEKSR